MAIPSQDRTSTFWVYFTIICAAAVVGFFWAWYVEQKRFQEREAERQAHSEESKRQFAQLDSARAEIAAMHKPIAEEDEFRHLVTTARDALSTVPPGSSAYIGERADFLVARTMKLASQLEGIVSSSAFSKYPEAVKREALAQRFDFDFRTNVEYYVDELRVRLSLPENERTKLSVANLLTGRAATRPALMETVIYLRRLAEAYRPAAELYAANNGGWLKGESV